jgi:5-hydroxydodecatetraenal polyketide synthase CpkC
MKQSELTSIVNLLSQQLPTIEHNPPHSPQVILLTGTTGFLGRYLLKMILEKTTWQVNCLIRADDTEQARQRLIQALAKVSCSFADYAQRISTVCGDITHTRLTMSPDAHERLSNQVDTVIHCAAIPNWVLPYHVLKPNNVDGTMEILQFCAHGKPKALHFISSMMPFIFDGTRKIIRESDYASPEALPNGYTQTKWIAEKLCDAAKQKGLNINIYRMDFIVGDSNTGEINLANFLCHFFKSVVLSNTILTDNTVVDTVPVDILCEIILEVIANKNALNQNFHILTHDYLSVSDICKVLAEFGYHLQPISLSSWKEAIFNNPQDPLFKFSNILQHVDYEWMQFQVDLSVKDDNIHEVLGKAYDRILAKKPDKLTLLRSLIKYLQTIHHLPTGDISKASLSSTG